MPIIGIDGFSIREMEEFWREIELFSYRGGNKHDLVSYAWLYFFGVTSTKINEIFVQHFGSRLNALPYPGNFRLDGILDIDVANDWIKLEPSTQKPWEKPEFDRAREVDKLLQDSGVQIAKKVDGRVFFRGQVVE